MSRLTVQAAELLYSAPPLTSDQVVGWDNQEEEMQDLMTGLVGLCLAKKMDYLTAPQLGNHLPIFVLNLPHGMPQIFIDPEIEYKKGRHLVATALNYKGDVVRLDTSNVTYADGEAMAEAVTHAMEWLGKVLL